MPKRRNGNQKTSVEVTDRDLSIFRHIDRYGLTVAEAVGNEPFFQETSIATITNRLNALVRAGFLQRGQLYAGKSYFQLGLDAAKLINARPESAKPIQTRVKVRDYGILLFCCLNTTSYEKLTPAEFQESFPQLFRNGEKISYYLSRDGNRTRLGYLRIDQGGVGSWDRLVSRCRDDVRKRCDLPGYRKFVDAGAFEITIVTAMEHKADRILELVNQDPMPVPLHVFVAPDLFPLVARPGASQKKKRGKV